LLLFDFANETAENENRMASVAIRDREDFLTDFILKLLK
jgi:hypothetical protein